ncbi:hypothetical protein E2C01_034112 [Portunus trituberculatus]|uniref:Uncharacterized protein n=1 Tax=Portunus trituberculatus TaxID=210409 RepID=A0A5B7F0L6_PORTR|nr:hypothetical protein [Portunus trituberculatus]
MTSTKDEKRGTELIAENQLEETGPSSPPVATVGAYHNVPEQRLLQKGEDEGEGEARQEHGHRL